MTAPETLAERLAKCVKPLEWVERFTDEGQRVMEARTSVGCYLVTDEGWFLLGQGGWNTTLALEAARAAAQADYTARILAALDMDAIARLVAEAVEKEREACARLVDCGCDPAKKAIAANGGNSGDRWRACQQANCGAQDAAAIRARGE